uniref:Serine/threonine-protein kinase-like protein CCR1 n=1 Tax=Nicotiana sylvestris TaxID=4096 RepID=A0A1U7VSG3_NICSY|nr:PREDICTED: serine/threonine-protein kinase-like protein CCR1 [Nicotiana sylvestris]
MQAAKGLEYLHKEVSSPIVHRDVKSLNILLDADWGACIADFGFLTPNKKDINRDVTTDVYNFGIVLLEILSRRKAYDQDCTPPSPKKGVSHLRRESRICEEELAWAAFTIVTKPSHLRSRFCKCEAYRPAQK